MLLHRLVIRLQYATRTLPVLGIVLLLFGEWLWSVAAFGGGVLLHLLLGAAAAALAPADRGERDERGHARPHRN